jgi:hypothetical protein
MPAAALSRQHAGLISFARRFATALILLFFSPIRDHRAPTQTRSMNALNPDQMTPAERLDEIGDLLAAGLIRLRSRKSSSISRDGGENSVDFSANQRGHVVPKTNIRVDE